MKVDRDTAAAELYLDLLKKCLTRLLFEAPFEPYVYPRNPAKARFADVLHRMLARRNLEIVRKRPRGSGPVVRGQWPAEAETMIGLPRLDNLQECVTDVLDRGVPGDLIETGVWRGGATIFMRAVLRAYGDTTRTIWVADSFRGLPPPDGRYTIDAGTDFSVFPELAISVEDVRANFDRYGLLDGQVRFLEGWFQETLPDAPIDRLAVLRLDGDMYESTIVALDALYPKLSPGGYLIVDDYALAACRQAVDDYRDLHGITERIVEIDGCAVFWRRDG